MFTWFFKPMNWVHRNRVVCWTGWSTRQRDRDRRPFMCTSLRLDTRARSEAITGIKPSPGEDESLRCPIRSCTPYKPFKMPLNPKLQCLAKEQEPPITWPSKLSLSLSVDCWNQNPHDGHVYFSVLGTACPEHGESGFGVSPMVCSHPTS